MIRATQELNSPMVVEFHPPPTDPAELARLLERQERRKRNEACWQSNAKLLYTQHRGKDICFAGGEYFVADDPREALAFAKAAHPDDDARFLIYVPKVKMVRIYANRRCVVSVR